MDLITLTSAWPVVTERGSVDGNRIKSASRCKSCEHCECLRLSYSTATHQICREGFSFYRFIWFEVPIVIGGVIHVRRNSAIGGARRKELKRLLVEDEDIQIALANFQRAEEVIKNIRAEATGETVAFLHDIRSSLGLVLSSCESLISENHGSTFGDKLKNTKPSLFRLYQSISLLSEQLGLADIISNPQAITYGKKSHSDIFQFFHKMIRLFQPRANSRRIGIGFEGNVYEHVELYNSFQLVPLILLDNAVKYAEPGSDIRIVYESKDDGLYIDFQSIGVPVPYGMEEEIFERGVRADNAIGKCVGSGLGLYIAAEVVRAHDFEISYQRRELMGKSDLALNSFILFIDRKYLS